MTIERGRELGYLKVLCNPFPIGNGSFVRCRCSACEMAVAVNIEPLSQGDYTCPGCGKTPFTQPKLEIVKPPKSVKATVQWNIVGTDGSSYNGKRQFASQLGISMYQAGKVVDGFVWNGIEYKLV